MKQNLVRPMIFVAVLFTILSCTKSTTEPETKVEKQAVKPVEDKTIKITISSSASYQFDRDDISIEANAYDKDDKPLKWTITELPSNKVYAPQFTNFSILREDFNGGKKYLLVSPKEYKNVTINLFAYTREDGRKFDFNFTIEKGGKVVESISKEINIKNGIDEGKSWKF